jgi:hypothetical protein
MPLADTSKAVKAAFLDRRDSAWRSMTRIDSTDGSVAYVSNQLSNLMPQKLIYAEGDSWFDKFTPIPSAGTNLLDEIRLPFHSAVVDVSHIGDEVRSMVEGVQARQTRAMFKIFDFDAILLSAGGNDLKNIFSELFAAKARLDKGFTSPWQPEDLDRLSRPNTYQAFFKEVIRNIGRFIDMRDHAENLKTRNAPIFVHGYDYFQPRPAAAAIFIGTRTGRGPWLYPSMNEAGLSDARMRSAADAVVDELNDQLKASIAPLGNVFVIDSRGLLTPAAAGSTSESGDWLDEIHPSQQGFVKLARNRWDVPLARAIGWQADEAMLEPSLRAANLSTAKADIATETA